MKNDDNNDFKRLEDENDIDDGDYDSKDSEGIIDAENNDNRSTLVSIITIVVVFIIGVVGVLIYHSNKTNDNDYTLIDSYPIAYNSELSSDGESFESVSFVSEQSQHAFVFSNNSEILPSTKIVEMYITFDGVKSLELLLNNYYSLEEEIAYNDTALIIHVIDSGSTISDRVVSALSRSFATSPKESWDYLGELIIISQLTLENNLKEDSIENKIVESANKLGINTITKENVRSDSFNEWLYKYNDEKISKIGSFVPTIFVNDKTMITDDNINDPELFISKIREM